MSQTAADKLFDAIDATWPPARFIHSGPWCLREGQGGGKRVSAATATGPVSEADVAVAEQAMLDLGQSPLFMIRRNEQELDTVLAAKGYGVVDPVVVLTVPVTDLTDEPIPPVTTFTIWTPLAVMADIWAQGGIGPARLGVMARAATKTAILARCRNQPAGVGFVAVEDEFAMVHAVEVVPHLRRLGVAQQIMRQAAFWSSAQGARTLAVLCTEANKPALALYSALGFAPAGGYHYRMRPEGEGPEHG